LEVFLEAKGLLETRGELSNPSLGLVRLGHIVGVFALFLLFFFVIKPWLHMSLGNGVANTVTGKGCHTEREGLHVELVPN
jgi:hypothetical protein